MPLLGYRELTTSAPPLAQRLEVVVEREFALLLGSISELLPESVLMELAESMGLVVREAVPR